MFNHGNVRRVKERDSRAYKEVQTLHKRVWAINQERGVREIFKSLQRGSNTAYESFDFLSTG